MKKKEFLIVPVTDVGPEVKRSFTVWSKRRFTTNKKGDDYRKVIPKAILQKKEEGSVIISVFEFGCSFGKNLYFIRKALPMAGIYGVDINLDAILEGVGLYSLKYDINTVHTNNSLWYLSEVADDNFDVSFTLSVLDHLPDPKPYLEHLLRITKKHFFAFEPYIPGVAEGLVKGSRIAECSYLWDYPKLFKELGATIVSQKLIGTGSTVPLGKHYWLFDVEPNS